MNWDRIIDIIPYLIGSGFIAAGLIYLIKILIEHFLAKDRARQDRIDMVFNEASREFKDAFNDVIVNLGREEYPVARLLAEFFDKHEIAFTKFKSILKGKALRALEDDWSKYKQFCKQNYHRDFVWELFASAKTEYEATKREEYRKHIKNLLSHAIIK